VSGDLGYHTARDAQQAGIGLIDIGHFGSEHLVVDVLAAHSGQWRKVRTPQGRVLHNVESRQREGKCNRK
jgi:putative NIF3 family GTP cyclohydrolase 1 type 2